MEEYGLRLEDYGRQMMASLPRLSKEKVLEGIVQYLSDKAHVKYFLLLSNKVGYYTMFRVESPSIEKQSQNIYEFLESSRYYNIDGEQEPYVEMTDIRHYELNEDHGHLEFWIGKEYFQLSPFDWGVEVI